MTDSLVASSAKPTGLQTVAGEMIFFQDANAFVSNLRCVFVGNLRVYAVSGITSVGVNSTPQKWGWVLICCIVAVVVAVNDWVMLAAFFIFLAFLLWVGGRPKHYLSLHTSGICYQPLCSKSREYIGSIVLAINNAILVRG